MATPETGRDIETFDELIFIRDLNEVHLLLDFISGRPESHIWNLEVKIPRPIALGGGDFTTFEIIERICQLRYPPESPPNTSSKAFDSAMLLYVKDKLNALAWPAKGMTIAYSYIFIEEMPDRQVSGDKGKKQQTRASVARTAYPGLVTGAHRFRCIRRWVSRFGVFLTFFAAYLLWLAVYGAQITARFEEDRKSASEITKQIYGQIDRENAKSPTRATTFLSVPKTCCVTDFESQTNEIKILCNEWSYIQARYEKSIADASIFAKNPPSSLLMILFPNSVGQRSDSGSTIAKNRACPEEAQTGQAFVTSKLVERQGNTLTYDDSRQEDIQSITLVLSAYTTYVLPVLFGLVGTIASLLRDIGNKLTDSVLAPRDETLALIRLILGAIAGVAVGLFFNPTSVAAQVTSGAGVVTLTASGIAFLAGYGADVFFKMLDALSNRVFSLEPSERPQNTKPTV
jgi:hypothetical protein